ncbi:MAG TPA: tRNA lysidine(34) synthetase TilS [Bryobacteraceae bacterium]|jgi:tRNA(Ile)-lysidine synthase|nr:tRNA lysidine(34) synthetase TilS [Bryobacteraceae bacterium]
MTVLAETLLDRVAGIIPRYSMLEPGDRVGVAVSGGADSVVLLHLLHRLAPRLETTLALLHVNHQLRGAESDADEEFVRRLGAALGLAVLVTPGAVKGDGNLEQEARQIRREFFQRCRAEHGLGRIALGHTRSDQAETVLFRLLRGSGLAGLAGMRPVTEDGLIRPLLTTSREEVRQWAAAEGLSWREDGSNANRQFARNRLRGEFLPSLSREFNANLEGVLAGTAELAQAEEDYWTHEVEPVYREITKRNAVGSILQVQTLRALHIAVQRRVIRRALREVKGDLRSVDFAHIEAILKICCSAHGHDRVIVPGVDALRSFDQLLLTRPGELSTAPRNYQVDLELGIEQQLPFGNGSIFVNCPNFGGENCVNFKKDPDATAEVADLDADRLSQCGESRYGGAAGLIARNWEPGDELQRPGHKGAEKIKSLFQEHRVALWERRHWPVVVAGQEIVWVRRFGSAAKFTASPESRRVIRLVHRRSGE